MIGSTLEYGSRFISKDTRVISDRLYNVRTIAESSMGKSSVLYNHAEREAGGTIMRMTIRPTFPDAYNLFDVTLKVIGRIQTGEKMWNLQELPLRLGKSARSDGSDVHMFERPCRGVITSETVRQSVTLKNDDLRIAPQVKIVETLTIFQVDSAEESKLKCWQRTCTYLPKSDLRYVDAKGRPVDLRWYEVEYIRE